METSQTTYLHRMFVVFVIAHSPVVRLRNKKTKKENRGLGRIWAWKGGAVFIRVLRKTRKAPISACIILIKESCSAPNDNCFWIG